MATPTRSQGVSTPRNHLTSTPNKPTASPRPNTGTLQNRPLSHKSPAVKTPASAHGHSHRISISSQPISTPTAAPVIHDELLNLNSPAAALIASIGGNTGLTPLAAGQDGLVLSDNIVANVVQDPTIPRDPELEKILRLQEVARLLETRSLGRGVSRKGVVALAKRVKFDQQWDGDTVNIAGNSVDLEMTFDSINKDVIRDITLNIVESDAGELQLQETASTMLRRQLVPQHIGSGNSSPWNSLDDFAANLQYLSHHDQLECPTNAFKLLGTLYETFQKIWLEEKKRMKERHEALHLCQGNIGEPAVNNGKRLGVSSRYWIQKHEYVAVTTEDLEKDGQGFQSWSARFSLIRGDPSITTDQDWLASDPLVSSVTTENLFEGNQIEKPNWKDTNPGKLTSGDVKKEEADAMAIDGPEEELPRSLGVQFVGEFDPPVLIPVNVVNEVNAQSSMVHIEQFRATTFQQALQDVVSQTNLRNGTVSNAGRWTKSLTVFDENGIKSSREHAYMLFTNGAMWCLPLAQICFHHPQQFAEILPIFRQYALLWSLLQTTVVQDETRDHTYAQKPSTGPTNRKDGVTRRSNKKAAQIQLEELLYGKSSSHKTLNIDISLDLVSEATNANIDILIPSKDNTFIRARITVRRNGVLDVPLLSGLPQSLEDKARRHATKVITLSEDIGVLARWLLDQSKKAA